jgi:arylsulfatase A-like enzyme/catechol 2,3-dioxygenase-like lactoylglutathione lyase family enzyme
MNPVPSITPHPPARRFAIAGTARAGTAPPNIILFFADDLGYADIGANGCQDIPTPHIDSIATGGARFTDGYATHPVCSPSRAGLMSGMYQHRFGFEHNSGPERYASPDFGLPREIPTLAEKLKAAGYATGMVGKWHIGFREGLRPHERGFDFFYGFLSGARSYYPDSPRERDPILRNGQVVADETEYLTDAFAREAVDFIVRSGDRPYFLYFSFNAVHSPLEATETYEARFPHIADGKRKTYAGMLAALDDAVGRVMAKVRQLGQEENTLVMFYSDNGGPTFETTSRNDPLRGYKGQLFEGGIRVPFVMQWKGVIPAGQVYHEPVMGFDYHATALAAANIETRSVREESPADRSFPSLTRRVSTETNLTLDGVNLIPFLTGEKQGRPHEQLFWRAGRQRAARVGDWKLVVIPQSSTPMLFHLKEDIGEQHDLANSRPDKLQELQTAFANWEQSTVPAKWVRQDARNAELGGALKTAPSDDVPRRRQRIGSAAFQRGASAAAGSTPAEDESPARGEGSVLARRFEELDRDGDGRLSPDEFPGPQFQEIDADGDGTITLDEARDYFSTRRAARQPEPRIEAPPEPDTEPPPTAPQAAGLDVVDAVFELCVRDVDACLKFYRDGLGMRQIDQADPQGDALLEWAGCRLRLRKVPGAPAPPAAGHPIKQMLGANGFRWFSLWYDDPAATAKRLVDAGYPAPIDGRNVRLTRDPEGNVVELMGIPRSAANETFTWGMCVGDDAAARRFYGQVLGLREFDPWKLPAPVNTSMYLFETGAGRVKFAAPPGERPRESDAGPDALGLRSVTLRVADLAAARSRLADPGATIDEDGRLSLADPDGNRIFLEQASAGTAAPGARKQSPLQRARALYGNVKPAPHEEEIAEQRPSEPPLKKMPDGPAARDAAGRGQLFESIVVPGFTGIQEGMNGLAIADLNRDGLLDIVATCSAPRNWGGRWGAGEKLRVFLNEGDFRFRQHPITILDSKISPEAFGRGQVPVLADFNKDGFLDLFVTRHAQMSSGRSNPADQKLGNGLYLTDAAWDVFRDVSAPMGIQNETAYNRQASIGDVNRDGWLDIAIGCDNIKDAQGGVPHSRLYVFVPDSSRHSPSAVTADGTRSVPAAFLDGRFEDIGGGPLAGLRRVLSRQSERQGRSVHQSARPGQRRRPRSHSILPRGRARLDLAVFAHRVPAGRVLLEEPAGRKWHRKWDWLQSGRSGRSACPNFRREFVSKRSRETASRPRPASRSAPTGRPLSRSAAHRACRTSR